MVMSLWELRIQLSPQLFYADKMGSYTCPWKIQCLMQGHVQPLQYRTGCKHLPTHSSWHTSDL